MNLDFTKENGLIPVVIQDNNTMQVLMVGYMNEEAYLKTNSDKRVTFFSRSKNRLWTKGETSGNYLNVMEILQDCDNDCLLIKVNPDGPTCHTGSNNCFKEETAKGFVYKLQSTIEQRISSGASDSYTNSLVKKGMNKVAQKVGEEAVELVIEAMSENLSDFKNEAADLLFHYLILLQTKGLKLEDIELVLKDRAS